MNLHFMTTPVSSTLILSVPALSALLLSSTSLQPHIPSLSPLPITSPLPCSPNLTVAASSLSIFSLPPFPVAVSLGALGQEFQWVNNMVVDDQDAKYFHLLKEELI